MNIIKDIVDGVRFFVAKKSKSSWPDDIITSVGREEFEKAKFDEVARHLELIKKSEDAKLEDDELIELPSDAKEIKVY